LIPTEAALELIPHAEMMSSAAASLIRSVSGTKDVISGTVRIAASEVIGAEIMPDMMREFSESYPKVNIELVLSSQSENLLKREADMAIRMFRPTQDAMIARKICDTPLGLFAHKDYLEKYGTPKILDDLQFHKGIGPDNNPLILQKLIDFGFPAKRAFLTFRTDNDLAQHALIRSGAGIGGMQIRIGRRDPDLVHLFPESVSLPMDLWLVMHEDLKAMPRVRLLYQFMADYLLQHFAEPL
jgi:DNA-binding transcriptional LysR family regulator